MDKIRVLVVDDAAAVRRLVTAALNRDPALEVVGTAADGRIALDRLDGLRPDVVLLDLEMPVMGGLETLAALRKTHPRLPVIMFSRHTHRGVEATVHALTLGADDYVPKPGDGLAASQCIEEQLIPKIKQLGRRAGRERHGPDQAAAAAGAACRRPAAAPAAEPRRTVEAVAIGASTGGPNALAELFPAFPPDWSVPILVAQHMPPEFTARLAERLTEKSRLRVREGVAGELLSAAQAWVAPGDYHMVLRRAGPAVRLALNRDPPVNSCRPSADVLFRSAAETYGPGLLAVVLTGMGQDGLAGCESVRRAGGQVIVQDEASSVVWSMPGAVARAGMADQVLPLGHLGSEIVRLARRGPFAEMR
jgi:two-component system chemotaxis response regulator CheB